jgi:predicted nucleic acid-binding Zn ribbon protein
MKYQMMCEKCGEVIIEHPMGEEHPELHDCGARMTKIPSVPGMVLRGSGFYSTDKALHVDKDAELDYKISRRSKGLET